MTNLAEREELTPELAQEIVVDTTPDPQAFDDPDQQLRDLGVLDGPQGSVHAARIQQALNKIHWNIKRSDVNTGPAVSVAECTDSVLDHAF